MVLVFKLLTVLCLVLVVAQASPRIPDRIAGGSKAQPGQFPFFAQLFLFITDHRARTCGGTLIARGWILTAAHCFRRMPRQNMHKGMFVVVMGTTKHDLHSGTKNLISDFKIHPRLLIDHADDKVETFRLAQNDVALAKLKRPYSLTRYVGVIHLPPPRETFPTTQIGQIVGAGLTNDSRESRSDSVMYANVRYWTLKDIQQIPTVRLDPVVVESKFYTLVQWMGGHILHGDSGGPFVCRHRSGGPAVQCGVASQGKTLVLGTKMFHLGVFEPVDRHMDFILKYVRGVRIYRGRPKTQTEELEEGPHEVQFKSDAAPLFMFTSTICLVFALCA